MSKEIAKILVDIKSINFSFDKYFTLTSGLASPVYVDCRKIISFTKERNFIIDKAIDYLTKNNICLLYTSPSPRDSGKSRMPSSA